MTQIICIANQKGGVGKTTTAINLSAAMGLLNKKTLLVDCDPQGNATSGLGLEKTRIGKSLYHGMIGKAIAEDVIVSSYMDMLKIIPSRVELAKFELEMMADPERETILLRFLSEIKIFFEYIILDCPPSLSLLTINAMTAADDILIPLQCEFYALEGLGQLVETMKRIRSSLNARLKFSGILLTMFDQRIKLSRQIAENAKKYFKHLVFNTIIPRNVRLGEAPSFGKTIFQHDANSIGAKCYAALANELVERES